MGVLDKLKNALFEVEYVEVEEPPKKEEKKKVREKRASEKIKEKANAKEKVKEKPIAKKIVLPGRKEEKIEELEEEELKDEDFEIRPKNEVLKTKPKDEFKFMDDKDFQVDQDYPTKDPEILEVIDDTNKGNNYNEERREEAYRPDNFKGNSVSNEYNYSQYGSHQEKHRDSKLYGIDDSYSVPVHEYGTYEKKEEKAYFKPSPIISPIYGVLDKNYKKDDVKEKKEVRLTTYSRGNVSVDDVRDKAYGVEKKQTIIEEDTKFEVEEDDNVLVDLSDRAKPEVKELTMGDAEEYFQDLGLEYNVDYVDVSKDKTNVPKKVTTEANTKKRENVGKHGVIEEKKIEEPKIAKVIEVDDEASGNSKNDDNDNLFDLIDSMYEEKGE